MKEVYRMTKDELAKQYGMKGLTEEQVRKLAQKNFKNTFLALIH